jgi:hypothetical protein
MVPRSSACALCSSGKADDVDWKPTLSPLYRLHDLVAKIFQNGSCLSVAGAAASINFDDAAVFWSAFYHLMFKKEKKSMATRDIVGALMVFGWAMAEQFHFSTEKGQDR